MTVMRVLPKKSHGIRVGQVYRDRKKRELLVQQIIDDIDLALCLVLSKTKGREWRGTRVRLDRLTGRGFKLLKDVPDDAHRCGHCKGLEPRVLLDEQRYCRKPTCWAVAHAYARGTAREREHSKPAGPLFTGGHS